MHANLESDGDVAETCARVVPPPFRSIEVITPGNRIWASRRELGMKHLARMRSVLASQGLLGLARRLRARLLHYRWRTLVFQDDVSRLRDSSTWPEGYRFELYQQPQAMDDATRSALEAAGGRALLDALDPQDQIYIVWHDRDVASYGGIFIDSPQRDVLGLSEEAILIGHCATVASHQRRGLYRLSLNDAARTLRLRKVGIAHIEAGTDNAASLGGITAAGFLPLGLVEAEVWFGSFVRRNADWRRVRRTSRR